MEVDTVWGRSTLVFESAAAVASGPDSRGRGVRGARRRSCVGGTMRTLWVSLKTRGKKSGFAGVI